MDDIAALFSAVKALFLLELSLYGFTFTFWQIFLFTGFAGIVLWIVREMLLDD